MKRRIVLRAKARGEIREAARWYERETAGLGESFVRKLSSLFARFVENPRQFPGVDPEVRRASLQRFLYFVYFLLPEPTVIVFAVLHHKRRPDLWRTSPR